MIDPAEAYRVRGWFSGPCYLDRATIPMLIDDVMRGQPSRVTVGHGTESWIERTVEPDSRLYQAMTAPDLMELIWRAVGRNFSWRAQIWSSVYEVGERIAWHKDASGDIQVLFCLEPAPDGCGGLFCIKGSSSTIELNLGAGDIVVFNATGIEHCTTLLVATTQFSHPRRVVSVARFFDVEREL